MRVYFWELAILIVASIAFSFDLGQSAGVAFNAALPITALVCSTWFLQILVLRERSNIESSNVLAAAVSLMGIALVSFVAGQYPWFHIPGAPLSAQVAGFGLLLLSCSLFLVVGYQIRHVRYLRSLTWLFLSVGGLFCLTQVVPGMGFADRWSSPDTVGSMFWIWLVAISSSQAIYNRELSIIWRTALICFAALALYRGLFLAITWTSGWLPPLVAIAVIFLFRLPRTVVGVSLLALPGALVLARRAFDLLMTTEHYSYISRLEAWYILWQLFEKSPLIGLGPANYYYYTALYPIFGWYVSFSSHNHYMDLLMQTGILGLLAFVWIIIEIIRIIFRLFRSEVISGFSRAYLIGALGALAGSLVSGMFADWIIPFYYNIGVRGFRSSLLFWLFLGGVLALKRITAREAADAIGSAQAAA
jgi:O-antigen ligase